LEFSPVDTAIGRRNAVRIGGTGSRTLVFSHGFGCEQAMWRHVAPCFLDGYRVVLFDHVGSGSSDKTAYDSHRHNSLTGYADDALELCVDLDLRHVTFVGHSVSAMIGAEVAIAIPDRVDELVMVGPSPCYLNDGDYRGGFEREDIEELLETLEANYLGWARTMAPVIMGRPDRPEFGGELTDSFCKLDPAIAAEFARVTFFSDSRAILPRIQARTLVVQCTDDAIAPRHVGEYTQSQIPNAKLVYLEAKGHCPILALRKRRSPQFGAFSNGEPVFPANQWDAALLDALPCGVVVTTLDGEIERANQEFLRWVGAGGNVGRPLPGVFTLGSRLFYETNLAPLVHLGGRVDEAVVELRLAGGGRMSALLNVREWINDADRRPRLLVVVFPANERRRYERELLAAERHARETAEDLRKAREAAEAASEAKTRFLTNMSHELRTPMNGILGFAGLLADTQLSGPQKEYVGTIQSSGEALLRIISDLLDLARVTAGRLELENLVVDLRKLLAGVCDLVAPRLSNDHTELSMECDPRLPLHFWGDPGRIRQILLNLVGNAAKFTEAGRISVRALRVGADVLRIEVADSGPGIAPEYRDRIFEKFDRGDPDVATRHGGTGLGLAIARELTEAMGGTIGVESEVGAGSVFWFTLPLRSADAEPAATVLPPVEPLFLSKEFRVLLAEDNLVNQRLARALLENLGCAVTIARDGFEAVQHSRQGEFDLIILDCLMPNMDGWQAAREMRQAGLSTPIVALTAAAMPGDRERCLEAGMDEFLTKPVRQAELAAVVHRWAGTTRLAQPF